jgi:hypothetical protein
MTKDEALDLALESLEYWDVHGKLHQPTEEAITAIKQARALDKKAENARELGLDYEPVQEHYKEVVDDVRALFAANRISNSVQEDMPKIGCVNHDCDKCQARLAPVHEPVNLIARMGDGRIVAPTLITSYACKSCGFANDLVQGNGKNFMRVPIGVTHESLCHACDDVEMVTWELDARSLMAQPAPVELGLDYEPMQKKCDCAAHSAADCVCGAWDKSAVAPVPVAWIDAEKRTFEWNGPVLWNTPTVAVLDKIPLYTTPPAAPVQEPDHGDELTIAYMSGLQRGKDFAAQRQWVGLTDEDKHDIELKAGITEDDDGYIVSQMFKLIEAKLKEKNA